MSSAPKFRELENSISTLKQTSDRLESSAAIVANDMSKIDDLLATVSQMAEAVLDCSNKFQDYKQSLS
jgi:hypothetical protein